MSDGCEEREETRQYREREKWEEREDRIDHGDVDEWNRQERTDS